MGRERPNVSCPDKELLEAQHLEVSFNFFLCKGTILLEWRQMLAEATMSNYGAQDLSLDL